MSTIIYIMLILIEVAYIVYMLYNFLQRLTLYTIILIMPAISLLLKYISAINLDQGVYVSELDTITHNVFAGPCYGLLLCIFITVVYFVNSKNILNYYNDKASNESKIALSIVSERITVVLHIFSITYIMLDMVFSGIPIFSQNRINRVNYWANYSTLPGAVQIYNFIIPLCSGLGIIYGRKKLNSNDSTIYIILIVISVIEKILLGYRLGGVIDVVVAFIIGYMYCYYSQQNKFPHNSGKIISIILSICILSCILFVSFQILSGASQSIREAVNSLLDRQFSLSGHLWWSVCNDGEREGLLFPSQLSELSSIIEMKSEMDIDIGVYGLMHEYAPTSLFLQYVLNGVRFGACFITVSIYYNGLILTLLMMIVNAFFIYYFIHRFLSDSKYCRCLSFIMLYRIFQVYSSYLTATGTLVTFFNIKTLIFFMIYSLLVLIENQFNKYSDNVRY